MIALMKERPLRLQVAANRPAAVVWWLRRAWRAIRQDSLPPYDVISITPGISGRRAFRRGDPLPIIHEAVTERTQKTSPLIDLTPFGARLMLAKEERGQKLDWPAFASSLTKASA